MFAITILIFSFSFKFLDYYLKKLMISWIINLKQYKIIIKIYRKCKKLIK